MKSMFACAALLVAFRRGRRDRRLSGAGPRRVSLRPVRRGRFLGGGLSRALRSRGWSFDRARRSPKAALSTRRTGRGSSFLQLRSAMRSRRSSAAGRRSRGRWKERSLDGCRPRSSTIVTGASLRTPFLFSPPGAPTASVSPSSRSICCGGRASPPRRSRGFSWRIPPRPATRRELGGVYHRWVKVYSPDRGWRFADPLARLGSVNAHYVPFAHRSWTKPEDLHLQRISEGAE